MDLEAISSNLQFLWRRRRIEWLFVCRERRKSQVYFEKSSKSNTQHNFHKILLICHCDNTKQVEDLVSSIQNVKKIFWICGKLCEVKQVGTQHHIHKIYLHYWNTTKQVGDLAWSARNVKKKIGFAINFMKLKIQHDIH